MKTQIRFGGPALVEGQSTWYDEPQFKADGTPVVDDRGNHYHLSRQARPGDIVDADKVANTSRPGKAIASEFVDRGMATWVGEPIGDES